MTDFQVSVMNDGTAHNELAVLRIASASKNSQSQFYPEQARVSGQSLGDLNRKMTAKLKLHGITATLALTLKLANDKTIVFANMDRLLTFDTEIDAITSLVTMKWQFIFNSEGEDHLHSVYLRVGERPNPAMLFQRVMSRSSDDMESIDREGLAPISCRVDFFDGRFSSELLTVVSEWVAALPKAEPTLGLAKWLNNHENTIGRYVVGVSPSICLAASAGLWLTVVSPEITQSVRGGVAWLIASAICFYFSRYISLTLMKIFASNITKMNAVPVFDITAGDRQRLTKFLAKSHRSMITASATAIAYGVLKGVGLWFASYVIRVFF